MLHYRAHRLLLLIFSLIMGLAVVFAGSSPSTVDAASHKHRVPFYRLYNGMWYFYTANPAERDWAVADYGYQYQGIAAYIYSKRVDDTKPLYRVRGGAGYLYTTNKSERDSAIKQYGYIDEGIAGYVFPKKKRDTTPLYRLRSRAYLYTTSVTERNEAIRNGYIDEGITGYVHTSP